MPYQVRTARREQRNPNAQSAIGPEAQWGSLDPGSRKWEATDLDRVHRIPAKHRSEWMMADSLRKAAHQTSNIGAPRSQL